MTRVIGPPKSHRRKWTFLCALLVMVGFGVLVIPGALAVHEYPTGMQLDGDVSHACPAGNADCFASQQDWGTLFKVTDTGSGNTGTEAVSTDTSVVGPTGSDPDFNDAKFIRDFQSGSPCAINSLGTSFCTGDDTTFATGSKDTLDIANGGWQCNHDNNVNSKIDIMNAYVASYKIPAGQPNAGDKVMYFGLEKNKDNGTNDVGFWFLQGSDSCAITSGHVNFTGANHTVGDVLIVSEFTSGGGVSNITAYRWVGGSNPLVQIAQALGNGGDCKGALNGDVLCATTNSGTNPFNTKVATPWLTSDATLGVGRNQIVPPDFFEGGIDITRAFNQSGSTAPSCFNTFIGDTRSSTTLTATLFDYALGSLGECKTTLSTQENQASSVGIGGGSVSSGTDTATLNVTGTPSWTGTLTFYLCGPVSQDGCDNTGVQVTQTNVSSADNTTTYTSGTATLTSAGRYCWHAHFQPSVASGNAGVGAADDDGTNECFTVTPASPGLVTHAGTSPVTLGSPVTDTATVSGLAKEPGSDGASHGGVAKYPTIDATNGAYAGTIQFTLKGPSTSGCGVTATGTGTNPQSITDLSGGNTTYGPVSFTPNNAGTFHWQATLSNASSVNNSGLPVSDNANCDQSREDVVVLQHPTTEATTPVDGSGNLVTTVTVGTNVFDHAVVTDTDTGGGSPTGHLDFWVCNPSQVTGLPGQETCPDGAGSSVQTNVGLNAGPGADQSQATTSTPVQPNTVGVWCFRSVYTPDTSLFIGSFDHSHFECFNVVDVSIATSQTYTVSDSVTITASGPGATVGGNVRFRLYPNADCSGGTTLVDQTKAVTNAARTASTDAVTITATPGATSPNLSWLVEYTATTGTAKNVSSACSVEHATLTIANG